MNNYVVVVNNEVTCAAETLEEAQTKMAEAMEGIIRSVELTDIVSMNVWRGKTKITLRMTAKSEDLGSFTLTDRVWIDKID